MSPPESTWTPEKDGLLRSMGAAGESVAAIATLLQRTPDAGTFRKMSSSIAGSLSESSRRF